MKRNDKSPDLLIEGECTTVLDDCEGDAPKDVATGENTSVTIGQLYSKYRQSAKEKADKKKKARKAKKKKEKKKRKDDVEYPVPLAPDEDIEEYPLFRPEILSLSESSLLSRNQTISERIRRAQGRAIPERLRLKLDADSGVFSGRLMTMGTISEKAQRWMVTSASLGKAVEAKRKA